MTESDRSRYVDDLAQMRVIMSTAKTEQPLQLDIPSPDIISLIATYTTGGDRPRPAPELVQATSDAILDCREVVSEMERRMRQ